MMNANDSSHREDYRRNENPSESNGVRPRFSRESARPRKRFVRTEKVEPNSISVTSSSEDTRVMPHRPRFQSDAPRSAYNGNESHRPSDEQRFSGDRPFRSSSNTRFQKPKRNAKLYSKKKQQEFIQDYEDPTKPLRLNKFLANAGICSRREADDFIQAGIITVNGEVVDNLGAKVLPTDKVMFHDQPVRREKKVYILLNKPKNTVTTTDDPEERHTVMDIVRGACSERIYPIGRLDRNTTGVLLLTNDGDLASKLTHPKFGKKKIYDVTLDRNLEEADEVVIRDGIMIDDEKVVPDALEFTHEEDRFHIGIEIHSGQNRVVRRIFEHVGYRVVKLDRVSFAGITKKRVSRGKYRFLTAQEVNMLKMGAFE